MTARTRRVAAMALVCMTQPAAMPEAWAEPHDISLAMPVLAAARGEIESDAIVLSSPTRHDAVSITIGDFVSAGGIIPAAALEMKIAVAWYQSGHAKYDVHRSPDDGRIKVESLLLNDERLIETDDVRQRNLLRVVGPDGREAYVDISLPSAGGGGRKMLASRYPVRDADRLQPLALQANAQKRLWATVDVPPDAVPGTYVSEVTLRSSATSEVLEVSRLQLVVYPFTLEPPGAEYSLYYRGILSRGAGRFITSEQKTRAQMTLELANMKRFGVDNPTVYQPLADVPLLEEVLEIRAAAGIDNRRIYYLGLTTGNYDDAAYWNRQLRQLAALRPVLARHGVKEFYLYGIDEAESADITGQYTLWQRLSRAGFRILAATWKRELVDPHIGRVDQLNCAARLTADEIAQFRAKGTKIYLYGQPQVGVQDPDIYRRNYGFELWRLGYDGEMDYAFQHEAGSIWNDFDDPALRDHAFAYPTLNGLVETLPWHAFRRGINDYRYVQTMVRRIDLLEHNPMPEARVLAEEGRKRLAYLRSAPMPDPSATRATIVDFLLRSAGPL